MFYSEVNCDINQRPNKQRISAVLPHKVGLIFLSVLHGSPDNAAVFNLDVLTGRRSLSLGNLDLFCRIFSPPCTAIQPHPAMHSKKDILTHTQTQTVSLWAIC